MLTIIPRIILSILFLVSSAMKFIHSEEFADSLTQVPMLNESLYPFVTIAVPLIEAAIGSLLLTGLYTKWASLASAVMLLVFAAVYIPVLLDPSIKANCACFGAASEINGWFVLRNIVLFTLSFYLFTQDRFILSLDNLKAKK